MPGIILYAEDNDNDVFLMQQAFKKVGGARIFRTARDGEEAVAYLSGTGKYSDRNEFPLPTVLLLDIKMPRMNGFEVLEWIRKNSSLPHLPVIMFSASLEEKDRLKAYALGANSFLIKPTDPQKLVEMVQTIESYWLRFNQTGDLENAVPETAFV